MAERKGFDAPAEYSSGFNYGIEQTSLLDSESDTESFLSDANPEDVTPISSTPEESAPATKADKKGSPSSTQKSQLKSEEKDEEPEVTVESFLDDEDEIEKKEDKSEEKTEDKSSETKTEITDEEENVYQLYSDTLFQMGIFSKDEDEDEVSITTPDEFKNRWEVEARKRAFSTLENFIGRFGEKTKNFVVSALNGVDPDEYYATYSNIENLSNLDITKEENQKMIFREYWKQQNLSNEKIEKRLQRAIELGELEEDSKDFHTVLMTQEEGRLTELQETTQKKLEQREKEKIAYSNGIRSILVNKLKDQEFDGIPVNDKVANEVFDFLVTEKYQLPSGELLTELDKFFLDLKRPENYEKRVKLALLAHSDFNLENVKKSAISKETNVLFGNLKKQSKKSQTATASSKATPTNTPRFKFNYPQ
jgi:hypothetical protein